MDPREEVRRVRARAGVLLALATGEQVASRPLADRRSLMDVQAALIGVGEASSRVERGASVGRKTWEGVKRWRVSR